MGENTSKNTGKIRGGASGKGFDVLGQPSPEAKSRGWDKRRAKLEIMDKITELRNMSMADLEAMREDIKRHPENHTVLEAKLVQYISKERFTIDFLDRNVGKAPQDIDISSGDNSISKVIVKFVDNTDERTGDDRDESIGTDTSGGEEI